MNSEGSVKHNISSLERPLAPLFIVFSRPFLLSLFPRVCHLSRILSLQSPPIPLTLRNSCCTCRCLAETPPQMCVTLTDRCCCTMRCACNERRSKKRPAGGGREHVQRNLSEAPFTCCRLR